MIAARESAAPQVNLKGCYLLFNAAIDAAFLCQFALYRFTVLIMENK